MSQAQAKPEHWVVSRAGFRGLYAVTPDEPDTGLLARKVRKALAGGARILQYRNKSANAVLRREQGAALLALCREARVPLVINDDLDLAGTIGADGLHLGREDAPIAAARAQLGKDRLLGVSCYDRLELALAAREAGADYVAFGSAFPSATKPGQRVRRFRSIERRRPASVRPWSRSEASRPKTRSPSSTQGPTPLR